MCRVNLPIGVSHVVAYSEKDNFANRARCYATARASYTYVRTQYYSCHYVRSIIHYCEFAVGSGDI